MLKDALQTRWLPSWLAGLLGAILVAVFTVGLGLGISPDSANYLSAAESLSKGRGLLTFDGGSFSSWPPLFPLLLSIPELLGFAPDAVARVAQLLLHAICLAFVVAWGIRAGLPRALGFALSAAVLLAYPPLRVACSLWSELLFIALCLLALERLVASEHGASAHSVWCAVIAAALASLTRYAGLALIISGALYLLSSPRQQWPLRIRRALLFAIPAFLPLALWMLRNLRLDEGPTGPRYPAMLTLPQVLELLGEPMPRLFLPESWSGWLPDTVWLMVFVATWGVLLWLSWRRRRAETAQPRDRTSDSAFALLLFVGVFVALLGFAIARNAMDQPNVRLLAPVVLPTLLAFTLVLSPRGVSASVTSTRGQEAARRVTQLISVGLLVLLAIAGAIQLPGRYQEFRQWGAAYALPVWKTSALATWIRENPPQGGLVSNQPGAVFYLCGIRSYLPPREKAYHSHNLEIQSEELRRFEGLVKAHGPRRGIYLAWFDESPPFLFELQTLRAIYQIMTPVAEFEDGSLLFVPWFEGSALE